MKNLNKKSDMYFIEKLISFEPMNISKVHLIDEDCNEFIATVNSVGIMKGYIGVDDIIIIDEEEYTEEKWEKMTRYIEYERAVVI